MVIGGSPNNNLQYLSQRSNNLMKTKKARKQLASQLNVRTSRLREFGVYVV